MCSQSAASLGLDYRLWHGNREAEVSLLPLGVRGRRHCVCVLGDGGVQLRGTDGMRPQRQLTLRLQLTESHWE